MFYVIDMDRGFVVHESRREIECNSYIYNCVSVHDHFIGRYQIVKGAKLRDSVLRNCR